MPLPGTDRAGLVEEVDVTIVGAGPAGCAAALALRRRGRSVQLVDSSARADARSARGCGETLLGAAAQLLDLLGLKKAFFAEEFAECQTHRSAWGTSSEGERSTLSNPYGPGWFVDRSRFDALLQRHAEQAGAHTAFLQRMREPARDASGLWISSFEPTGRVRAAGCAPRVVRSRFLIDASGRHARVSRHLGATRELADRLVAISGEFSATSLMLGETHVETDECGWWYVSQSSPGRCTVALMTDADLVRPMGLGHAARLQELFARSVAARRVTLHAALSRAGTLKICSAATGCMTTSVGPGWAAAGDAAFTIDPLSSRGISAALLSGLHLAEAVHADLDGDAQALARYAGTLRAVYAEHRSTQRAYYGMERRFADAPFWRRRTRTEPARDTRAGAALG